MIGVWVGGSGMGWDGKPGEEEEWRLGGEEEGRV